MPGIIEPWKLASAHGHTCYSTWLVIILGQDTLSSDHEIKHYQCLTFPLLNSLCQLISLKLSCFYPVCVSIFNNIVLFQSLFFQLFYYYYYFFLLYNIVLVLPYINMHPPRVYTCSPSRLDKSLFCLCFVTLRISNANHHLKKII